MIWIISDTHFGHSKTITDFVFRPFANTYEMDAYMMARWRSTVASKDIIWHLGDFAFTSKDRALELLAQLSGTKMLVKGNHDRGHQAMREIGFDAVVCEAIISVEGKRILLSHKPLLVKPNDVDLVFHGHIHRGEHHAEEYPGLPKWNINCCVEKWGYAPVSAKYLVRKNS